MQRLTTIFSFCVARTQNFVRKSETHSLCDIDQLFASNLKLNSFQDKQGLSQHSFQNLRQYERLGTQTKETFDSNKHL